MKEKGYSAREKRVTEQEFNRKWEIEAKMAEDAQRSQQQRLEAEEKVKESEGRNKRIGGGGRVVPVSNGKNGLEKKKLAGSAVVKKAVIGRSARRGF